MSMFDNPVTFAVPAWFWGFAVLPFFIALAFANERAREMKLDQLVAARLRPRLRHGGRNVRCPARRLGGV